MGCHAMKVRSKVISGYFLLLLVKTGSGWIFGFSAIVGLSCLHTNENFVSAIETNMQYYIQ